MLQRLTLLLVLLSACAEFVPPTPAGPATLWLQPDDIGYSQQLQWGRPLPESFSVEFISHAELAARCGGAQAGGCSGQDGEALLREDLPEFVQQAFLLHEMGHVLGAGHIEDPEACPEGAAGAFVMCAWGNGSANELAPEDLALLPADPI